MPADGSIIIDTRVNNKGAEADLKARRPLRGGVN